MSFIFVILLVIEHILCWFFGILASLASMVIFLHPDVKLYSEALLSTVYVILGIYAWITWQKNSTKEPMPIVRSTGRKHVFYVLVGAAMWFVLGYFFKTYTTSNLPWADAFTTAFAFVATYLEARKLLNNWIYWICLNAFSIWLYYARDLKVMAFMMAGFFVLSILGYIRWTQSYRDQNSRGLDHLILDKE